MNRIPPQSFTFDTYKLVRQLEKQGLTRGQSVAIMRTVNTFIVNNIRSEMLATTDQEQNTFHFKSQIQSLRNDLTSSRQSASQTLIQTSQSLQSQIDSLGQKFGESLTGMKSDIAVELSNRKGETREESKSIDLTVQEAYHELRLRMSDMRTTIESMKMQVTQSIVWVALGTFASLVLLDYFTPIREDAKPKSKQKDDDIPILLN